MSEKSFQDTSAIARTERLQEELQYGSVVRAGHTLSDTQAEVSDWLVIGMSLQAVEATRLSPDGHLMWTTGGLKYAEIQDVADSAGWWSVDRAVDEYVQLYGLDVDHVRAAVLTDRKGIRSFKAKLPEHRAVAALDMLKVQLQNYARNGSLNVGQSGYAELAGEARRAVRPLLGRRIIGAMMTGRYYDFRPTERPVWQPQKLETHHNVGNDFKGILTGLVNVEVPHTLPDRPNLRRICLRIAPLSKRPDEAWDAYYSDPARQAQSIHPFGVTELAGRSAWVPVECLVIPKLHFPESPEDSTVLFRR